MRTPMLAGADKQTVAQPWLEETIFVGFVEVHMTAQYDFDIGWMRQEYN